jgi:hypothetical protein
VKRIVDDLSQSSVRINQHYALPKQSTSKINYLQQFDLQTPSHSQDLLFNVEDSLPPYIFINTSSDKKSPQDLEFKQLKSSFNSSSALS